jgi:hypothetical protein
MVLVARSEGKLRNSRRNIGKHTMCK